MFKHLNAYYIVIFTQWQENELVGNKEIHLVLFNEQMREILHEHVMLHCKSLVSVILSN